MFSQSPSPHLQAKGSVPQTMWVLLAALLPLTVVSIFSSGGGLFRVVLMTLAGSLLAEVGMRHFLKKPVTLYDGSAAVNAFILALILPPGLPSWMVILGAAFGTAVAKEVFGGLGQNLFHPALVGNAFLLLTFPLALNASPGPVNFPAAFAALLGGLILIFSKVISWDTPLLYLMGIFIFSMIFGEGIGAAPVFLAAFFLVTDSVTTPLTRWGKQGFAIGAALLTAFFRKWGAGPAEGITYGVLLMNALTPRLDHWLRPARARKAAAQ